MAGPFTRGAREQKAMLDLFEALGSSLDIRLVLERAYPSLLQIVPADYGALGISSSGRPEDYEWIVAKIPPAFFAAYPEMAPHDFVRMSVTRQVNVVLRDEEMVPRPELERNLLYRRAHEIGVPLEQVMAVMLHIDDRWQSGLSLYRERRRPFSEGERASLQRVTPAIVNAVRNCHLFGAATAFGMALEALLDERGEAVVLVAPPAIEVARSAAAEALIDRWFAPHERRVGRLPEPLTDALAGVVASAPVTGAVAPWTRPGEGATLEVSFFALGGTMGKTTWLLHLRERADELAVPAAWRAVLTAREQEVTAAVLRGWDNKLIADELGCSRDTVKKHLLHVFDKLGLPNRATLIAKAAELTRSEQPL